MATTYHKQHPLDREAVAAMRREIATHPPLAFTPSMRPVFDALMSRTPAAADVRHEADRVGGVPGWWCRPTDAIEGAALLYLHGGAYVMGSAFGFCNFIGQLASRAKVATFAPDYRLAPEHKFPAAIEDAQAAYHGLVAAGATRIALAGDSAGGGLTLSLLSLTAAAARTGKAPRPLSAAVMSPWTDLTLGGYSMVTRATADPLLRKTALADAARLLLEDQDRGDPRVSPLFGDLSGLPPVLVHVGGDEILLDDSRRYAQRMEAAGGSVDLHVWEGMLHVFPADIATLVAAGEACDHIGDFLRATLREGHHQAARPTFG
jgi:epsilon-lactone hydrolase